MPAQFACLGQGLQGIAEVRRVPRPVLGSLGQQLHDKRTQFRAHQVRGNQLRPPGYDLDMGLPDVDRRGSVDGQLAGHRFVVHHAQGV